MKVYKALEPDDGVIAQFAAVHVLRWRPEWGEPKLLFIEAEPGDLVQEEHIKALVGALRTEEWIAVERDFYGSLYICPWCNALKKNGHESTCMRQRALAPFQEPPNG